MLIHRVNASASMIYLVWLEENSEIYSHVAFITLKTS